MFEFPLSFDEDLAERSFSSTDWTLYGIDDEDPGGNDDDEEIIVPESLINLTEDQLRQLRVTVDPLSDDGEHGCNLSLQAVRLISTLIG